jgi:uncharacterized phage-associated protein
MANISAQDVADYFLASVDEDSGDNISNLKLQKLLYYAQGYYLALNDGTPLFDDEIQAWAHGPVVPEVYRRYKVHGSGAIPAPVSCNSSKLDEATREFLNEVWRVCGQYSPWKLREMTHEEPPWKETPANQPIALDSMRNYFRTLLEHGQG